MTHTDFRWRLRATVSIGGLTVVSRAGASTLQGGSGGGMMGGSYGNGWMSGYGGAWMLVLVVLVAGCVAWFVSRGRNRH